MRRALAALLLACVLVPPSSAGPSAPPPTPVPPHGSPSPFPTALDTPEPSDRPPTIDAASAVLVDLESGRALYEKRAEKRRPIASTTKIMTAMLVLSSTTPFDEVATSPRAAAAEGAELGLEAGERRPVGDLLFALMLQSANDAAIALAEHVGGSVKGFVRLMNTRARELGLVDTRFRSPNGLDDSGYSTAADLAAITVEAFRDPAFAGVVSTKKKVVPAPDGPARRIQNRNALLWLYPGATGVKTGYTAAAGFCLVAAAEREDLRLAAVVLGSRDEAFSDAATLLDHGFATYERRVAVTAGDPLTPIRVQGREVPVAAAETVSVVIGRRNADPIVRTEPRAGLRLPVARGAVVGEVVVEYGDPLGPDGSSNTGLNEERVPLVSAREVRPAPAPVPTVPWWRRLAEVLAPLFAPILPLTRI